MSASDTLEVVGAAILDGRGRCLATQRSASMPLPLQWEFPGGKVEPGERPENALAREIREELELEIAVGAVVATGYAPIGDGRRVGLTVYRAQIVAGAIRLREHARFGWFDAAGLAALDWAEADRPAVAVLCEELAV